MSVGFQQEVIYNLTDLGAYYHLPLWTDKQIQPLSSVNRDLHPLKLAVQQEVKTGIYLKA